MIERQRTLATPGKILLGLAMGLSLTAACVAASTATGEARAPDVHPITGDTTAPGDTAAVIGAQGVPPGVINLAASDGGGSDERSPIAIEGADGGDQDAGNDGSSGGGGSGGSIAIADAGTDADAGDSGANAGPAPSPAPVPGTPPVVEVKPLKFENGDVPKAEKALSGKKLIDAIAKCVGDAGGLTAKTGSLKVELLVRARGKAEGVEVKAQGTSKEAAQCVRTLLKNRTVGVPTADPTGVTVIYSLKPGPK